MVFLFLSEITIHKGREFHLSTYHTTRVIVSIKLIHSVSEKVFRQGCIVNLIQTFNIIMFFTMQQSLELWHNFNGNVGIVTLGRIQSIAAVVLLIADWHRNSGKNELIFFTWITSWTAGISSVFLSHDAASSVSSMCYIPPSYVLQVSWQ